MGFRSVFVTEDCCIQWPDWFREKYQDRVHFSDEGPGGPISSKHEGKLYTDYFGSLAEDIRKAINWKDWGRERPFVVVFMHECGGITKAAIWKDHVRWMEPEGWDEVYGSSHSYCGPCDLPPEKK